MPTLSVRCMYTYYFLRYIVYEVLNCYEKLQNIEAEDGKSWQNTSMDRHSGLSSVSSQNNTVCKPGEHREQLKLTEWLVSNFKFALLFERW